MDLKSTFHNSVALCNISLGAVFVVCRKRMLEIHPGQGVSDVPCDFSVPRGPDTSPLWSQWKLRGSRTGHVEARVIEKPEDINLHLCTYMCIDVLYLCLVCAYYWPSSLSPDAFRGREKENIPGWGSVVLKSWHSNLDLQRVETQFQYRNLWRKTVHLPNTPKMQHW